MTGFTSLAYWVIKALHKREILSTSVNWKGGEYR